MFHNLAFADRLYRNIEIGRGHFKFFAVCLYKDILENRKRTFSGDDVLNGFKTIEKFRTCYFEFHFLLS